MWTRGSLRLLHTTLPLAVPPMGQAVDLIDVAVAVKGAIRGGPRPQALAQWRDEGGTLEVERVELVWGALSGTANATMALDAAMQPMGSGTASIQGYGEIVDALVANGQMKPGDALLARLGLGVLAKPGRDGRPQLEGPITLQNSELRVAQIRVARLPRFTWE